MKLAILFVTAGGLYFAISVETVFQKHTMGMRNPTFINN
jgi:hypothetical protein